jgi:hypothetical protein
MQLMLARKPCSSTLREANRCIAEQAPKFVEIVRTGKSMQTRTIAARVNVIDRENNVCIAIPKHDTV